MVHAPSYVQDWGFQPRFLAGGEAFGWPRFCGLGSSIGIGWKGTRISFVGRHACSPLHGPRTVTIGPLLQRRETRCPDQIPVTRFMLFEQAVADQQRDPARAHLDRRDQDHTP